MPAAPPPVGTVENGYRYKGGPAGDPSSWERVSAPAASGPKPRPDWGQNAYELPNGTIDVRGPRGGHTYFKPGDTGAGAAGSGPSLTEDQGKSSQAFGNMADAERAYLHARDQGYNPTSLRNSFAAPFDGGPGKGIDILPNWMGSAIRDDVSDLGRQAELQWSDANLRSVSGANAPEPESAKLANTYFPHGGESLSVMEPRYRQGRQASIEGVRRRAGPGVVGDPPPMRRPVTDISRNNYAARVNTQEEARAPMGSKAHPLLARDQDTLRRLAHDRRNHGKWAIGPSGALVQIGTGEVDESTVRPEDRDMVRRRRRPEPPQRRPTTTDDGWTVERR